MYKGVDSEVYRGGTVGAVSCLHRPMHPRTHSSSHLSQVGAHSSTPRCPHIHSQLHTATRARGLLAPSPSAAPLWPPVGSHLHPEQGRQRCAWQFGRWHRGHTMVICIPQCGQHFTRRRGTCRLLCSMHIRWCAILPPVLTAAVLLPHLLFVFLVLVPGLDVVRLLHNRVAALLAKVHRERDAASAVR